jgi:hypothetical protein
MLDFTSYAKAGEFEGSYENGCVTGHMTSTVRSYHQKHKVGIAPAVSASSIRLRNCFTVTAPFLI